MAVVAAHRLLVALNATRKVLDERRARQTDGRVGALEEAREELVEVAAKDLLEVDGLGLCKDVSDDEANGNEDDRLPTGPGCSTGRCQSCKCSSLPMAGSVACKREAGGRTYGDRGDRRGDGKDNGELSEHRGSLRGSSDVL